MNALMLVKLTNGRSHNPTILVTVPRSDALHQEHAADDTARAYLRREYPQGDYHTDSIGFVCQTEDDFIHYV